MTATHSFLAGRYRLLQSLGQGGMGRIWLALDEALHRQVALKEVVPPDGVTAADLEEMLPRTLREARTAARLNHPNVVRVYDVILSEGAPWIVMEYLPSRSLYQVITADGPMPPAQAAGIGLSVLAALRAAHAVGIVHRDVKPGNVLIADDGRVVLTDFGLARTLGHPSITRTGVILGSPAFMAPERVAHDATGPESDLWSLGATLYFAVEGRSPYERASTMATLAALATEDPPRSRRSGALWPVLEGLLRRNPAARWDAGRAEKALRRIAGGSRAPKTPPRRPPRTIPAPVPRAVPPPAPQSETDVETPAPFRAPACSGDLGSPRRARIGAHDCGAGAAGGGSPTGFEGRRGLSAGRCRR
jgi:serine/threonine protein kinase